MTYNRQGIQLPYGNYQRRFERFVGFRVYVLKSWGEKHDDPDFDIDDPTRNLVAIDESDSIRWIVEAIDPPSDTNEPHHEKLYNLDGRVISKTNTGQFYEIDTNTGAIVDSWAETEFTVADEVLEFDGPLYQIEFYNGVYVIQRGGDLYGIDESGTVIWKRVDEVGWILEPDEETFTVTHHESRGRGDFWYEYELDVETGEIHNVNDKPEKFLGEIVDRPVPGTDTDPERCS